VRPGRVRVGEAITQAQKNRKGQEKFSSERKEAVLVGGRISQGCAKFWQKNRVSSGKRARKKRACLKILSKKRTPETLHVHLLSFNH